MSEYGSITGYCKIYYLIEYFAKTILYKSRELAMLDVPHTINLYPIILCKSILGLCSTNDFLSSKTACKSTGWKSRSEMWLILYADVVIFIVYETSLGMFS